MIRFIKWIWNWLQTTGEQYRNESKTINSWPFPVEPKIEVVPVKKKPTLKKATTRAKKPAVVAKTVAKKTTKKKAK
jgi:hypothetical protein